MKNYLAFDLGASNGRAILGQLHHDRLTVQELYRFENGYVEMNGIYYWDFPYLLNEIKKGFHANFEVFFEKNINLHLFLHWSTKTGHEI